MKSIIINAPGNASVGLVQDKQLQKGEVKIKLYYVGICGSDLSTYMGKNPMVKYPRIPGHEISGEIVETGEGVSKEYVGRQVTCTPYTNCGQCYSCKTGRTNACKYNETLGVQRDGAMTEFHNVPFSKLLFADGLSRKKLALVEPLSVGFHAVARGEVIDNDVVMVLGCGMIGAGAIIRSVLRGAKVIAVDIDERKLKIAKSIGATHTINAMDSDFENQILRLTNGFGPSVTIEAAGNIKTYQTAIAQVAFTGRVVFIGYAGKEIAFPTHLFVQKELDMRGSRNATRLDFEAVINYLKDNDDSEKLITKVITPDQFSSEINSWSENPGSVMKILVEF
ncbi:2-desacetyl-2-hydroxyethyl bacteriochlorophyllide A dehydrogenase [Maribacter vaceletii]|uniref:2-desacetyl-2-hydroxyethyl bacteriochlorophyllide A dehydrogenase n=1 Tax=Maribacter vaceletii TaxID=1206816 RepID=A0A495DU26_9FLAO|nr:zinc-binding alcohol dehydrogenase family protein [Maribacter vaceletii]RKR07993.1 2-desacetyl-2-hydroxyethyl bacteriochlorophyllide A dehydrogenase [Maribacter vaceletii]